jgi:hypothetical protein
MAAGEGRSAQQDVFQGGEVASEARVKVRREISSGKPPFAEFAPARKNEIPALAPSS